MSEPLVLCYHAVSERWPAALSVTPKALASQLEFLVGRGYRGTTFSAAVAKPPAKKTFVITFDDSYRSVRALAAPILDRLGLVGTVFVPTSYTGKAEPMCWAGIDHWLDGPFAEELTPMAWGELRELASHGWEIGSHTCTHPRLTKVDDETLERELRVSRAELEQNLEARCRSIAYPYGDHDDRVVRATEAAGYEAAATLPERFDRAEPLRRPRVGIYHSDAERRVQTQGEPARQAAELTARSPRL